MLRMLFVIISIFILLNACSSGDQLTQLVGTEWNVTSLLGKSLNAADITKGLPSLNFSDNGKLFGSTGCNSFTGSYKIEGTKLSLDPGAMTKMMCSDNTEQDFLNAINQVTNIKQNGNTLQLLNGAKTVMSLDPKTR
jgi:heat shock protein HslJ